MTAIIKGRTGRNTTMHGVTIPTAISMGIVMPTSTASMAAAQASVATRVLATGITTADADENCI